jgi:hypothetical protein
MAIKGRRRESSRNSSTPRAARPRLPKYDPTAKPIWEVAEELAAEVPDSEWRKLPADLAKNLHHYLHGAPKEEADWFNRVGPAQVVVDT